IAASFVRCDDTALLGQVAAAPVAEALQLRLLAPTVAGTHAPIADGVGAMRVAPPPPRIRPARSSTFGRAGLGWPKCRTGGRFGAVPPRPPLAWRRGPAC